ncbi:MAG: hypothetical protein ACOVKP_00405 [Flavobacterium sp.]|jgi:hypothetical protein
MNLFFIIIGLNVSIIFLFDKTKLEDKKWFKTILLINLLFFIIALICFILGFMKSTAINSLFVPFISQLSYFGLNHLFYLIHKKNSEDTFWSMDKSLYKDGFFNALVWIILLVPFLFFL